MSATERVVQSVLYELGCVLIGCLVMQFVLDDYFFLVGDGLEFCV